MTLGKRSGGPGPRFQRGLVKLRAGTILLVLLAFALRMWDLGGRGLWFDEAIEFHTATVPFARLPDAVRTSFQGPLYTYLLFAWAHVARSAVWLRFLSVGFSLLAVVGMVRWVALGMGRRSALLAGLIMALLPAEVRFGQEVGEYALMSCLVVWSLVCLERTFGRTGRTGWRSWFGWALLATLAAYTHYGSALVSLPVALAAFAHNLRRARYDHVVRQSVVCAVAALACVPLFIFYLRAQLPRQLGAVHWIPFKRWDFELAWVLPHLEDTFMFHQVLWPHTLLPRWPAAAVVDLVLLLVLVLVLAVPAVIRPTAHLANAQRLARRVVLVTAVYAVIVRMGWYGYGNYGQRYALMLSPMWVMAATLGIGALQGPPTSGWVRRALPGLLAVSLVCLSGAQLAAGPSVWPETREDVRTVAVCWGAAHGPGDLTIVAPGAVPAFAYYLDALGLDRTGVDLGDPLAPAAPADWWARSRRALDMGELIERAARSPRRGPTRSPAPVPTTAAAAAGPAWLVVAHTDSQQIRTWLADLPGGYHSTVACRSGEATVFRLERR